MGVDRLFVFECFGDVFKGGSYEVERGGLGLAGGGRICPKVQRRISRKISRKVS